MWRIRFHGRGGQGMKTASRILGSAFFQAGYEVQDAPRYGAERRGAPIFATVRADRQAILERGPINQPDLVIVADDTLVAIPAAGVMHGIDDHTHLLINSTEHAETWRQRLNLQGPVHILPLSHDATDRAQQPLVSATCAGAAAALIGVIDLAQLRAALQQELAEFSKELLTRNIETAEHAFQALLNHKGVVKQRPTDNPPLQLATPWIDLAFEPAHVSAPTVYGAANSVQVKTGLWRTLRPVIDYQRCNQCWWVCSTFCPDGAIEVVDGRPVIDYEHCKGCMVCLAQCPPKAISAVSEHQAQQQERSEVLS